MLFLIEKQIFQNENSNLFQFFTLDVSDLTLIGYIPPLIN